MQLQGQSSCDSLGGGLDGGSASEERQSAKHLNMQIMQCHKPQVVWALGKLLVRGRLGAGVRSSFGQMFVPTSSDPGAHATLPRRSSTWCSATREHWMPST